MNEAPSRTHSILDLTSSTLGGIYQSSSFQSGRDYDQPATPWGTGAQTPRTESHTRVPSRRKSSAPIPQLRSTTAIVSALALRSILLFGTGMGYGLLVRHLHDDRRLAPFQVEGIIKPRNDWTYLTFWGMAGLALGTLMPCVDTLFEAEDLDSPAVDGDDGGQRTPENVSEESGFLGADWTPVVRSVGAFVGIAYAIVGPFTPYFLPVAKFDSANSPGLLPCKLPSHSLLLTQHYGISSIAPSQVLYFLLLSAR